MSDSNIRAALRTYASEQTVDNLARYWRECLRANELPSPNAINETYFGEFIESITSYWILAPTDTVDYYYKDRMVMLYERGKRAPSTRPITHAFGVETYSSNKFLLYKTETMALKRVKNELRKLLAKEGY